MNYSGLKQILDSEASWKHEGSCRQPPGSRCSRYRTTGLSITRSLLSHFYTQRQLIVSISLRHRDTCSRQNNFRLKKSHHFKVRGNRRRPKIDLWHSFSPAWRWGISCDDLCVSPQQRPPTFFHSRATLAKKKSKWVWAFALLPFDKN